MVRRQFVPDCDASSGTRGDTLRVRSTRGKALTVLRNNWITWLALLNGAFLVFMAVGIGVDDGSTTSERFTGLATMGVASVAFLGGLWGLRSSRLPKGVSLAGIVVGIVGTLMWFWMIFPPILALIVLWFGVIRDGLAAEASPA